MNRWLAAGAALAVALVLASQAVPADPWGWSGLWPLVLAVAAVALLVRGLRLPGAPRATRIHPPRRVLFTVAAILGAHLALPQWGLVRAYEGDPFRMELIATALLAAAGMVVLLFATEESNA